RLKRILEDISGFRGVTLDAVYAHAAILSRERRATAAGLAGVGILDAETALHQALVIIEDHPVQIREALGIDKHFRPVLLEDIVLRHRWALLEADDVAQSRASAALNAETQARDILLF